MGRKKISMNFIEDDRKRASTFDKRRIGLFKKASELNRLCGVSISVIIVNKNLVYKFSDPPNSFYKNFINNKPEKFEEDFNNDSLLDFINKKAQKNPYTNDNNSNEHHSLEEEPNGTLTDDEEDQQFLDVLDEHHLRDVYNNIDPNISPIKENVDILQTKNLKESDQISLNSSGLMAYNFASNNQNIAQILPNVSINEMHMKYPSKQHDDIIPSTKMENVYSELVTISSAETYLFENSSYNLNNSNWQTYKSQNFATSNLNFNNNTNYQNSANYLETPTFETCSNGIIMHLPNILHSEEDDRPNLKRLKRFNDSTDN